jgi:uncharacterized protein (DUF849 family)
LAKDAIAVRRAGADELHVHVRSPGGEETLEPEAVAAALTAIRNAVPGMPVGISSGAWIAPGGASRRAHMRSWSVRPDYVSVNLNEDDAPEVIEMMVANGVGVEAGLWNAEDARRFIAEISPDNCLRVLVEMNGKDAGEALAEADRVFGVLAEAGCSLPILLHGQGGSVWTCIAEAWRRNLSTRVGFEDGLHLPDGTVAPDNASLVTAALSMRTT